MINRTYPDDYFSNRKPKASWKPAENTEYFETREEARFYCRNEGIDQTKIINDKGAPKGKQWSV